MTKSLARQRYLIDHAFASLARHKSLNLGLLLVYTLIVFGLASVMMFSHALRSEAAILFAESPDLVLQHVTLGRHELIPADYLPTLEKIPGVEHVEGRLWGYYYDPVVAANYTLIVPPSGAPAAGSVAIGEGIARTRGASVGDVLAFRGHGGKLFPFTIAAILPADSDIITADLMLLSAEDFRQFFGIDTSRYTDFVLQLSAHDRAGEVAAHLATRFPDTRQIQRDEIQSTYSTLFDWREGIMLLLLIGALLALIIFIVQKASGLSAEDRNEVGILKAMGWDRLDIIASKCWEGVLIAGSAFLIGCTLAYWHVFSASFMLLEPLLMGWSSLEPDLHLTPFMNGIQLLLLFTCTVFPYAMAMTGPVWRAVSADPDNVMR
jgi:ABC-type lipoprotein release transport system permease subunit